MKLFTKEIDKKLFAQYSKGGDLTNQKVIAKIFNPYGRGRWYILNSDPNDPDYLWCITELFEVEVGSVSRKELESLRIKPFMLPLERDLYFSERNALEVYKGLLNGETYGHGGELEMGIKKEMEEHGMSHDEARKTALDHLKENPHYYSISKKVGLADGGRLSDSNYLVQMAEEYAEREYEKPVKKGQGIAKATKNGDSLKYTEVIVYFKDGTNHTFKEDDFEEFFDVDEYAKGGFTPKLVNPKESRDIYYYTRFKNAIGSFGWIHDKKYYEGILYPLSDFDKKYYSHLKLKDGEVLLRYKTERMMDAEGERLIKINMDKGLIYFLDDVDDKNPTFDSKGTKLDYLTINELNFDLDMFAKGGKTKLMLNYVSPRDISILKITTDDGKKHLIKGESIISGEYKLAKGGKLTDNYVYIPKRNIDKVVLKNGETTDDNFNGFYVKKEALKGDSKDSTERDDAVSKMKEAIANVKSIKTLKPRVIAETLRLGNTFAFQDAVQKSIENNKKSEAIDVYADAINTLTNSNKYLVTQNLAEFGNPNVMNLFPSKYVDVPSLKLKPIKRKQNVEDDEALLKQINKFTGDSYSRSSILSIKFDNHSVVATDSQTLVHVYNETNVEPKQICVSNECKKNNAYDKSYPDWSRIIVSSFDKLDSCEININDFLKLAEFSENQFTDSKNKDNFGAPIQNIAVRLNEKNIFFQSRFIIKAMTTLKILGLSKCKMFYGQGSNQPVYFTSTDANNNPLKNDFVLLMPFLKLDESIKNFAIDCKTGEYVIVGGEYKKGGVTFDDKVKAVESNLFGKEVPKKYRTLYGKTYNKKEAHESAQKIIGAQVKKYNKK